MPPFRAVLPAAVSALALESGFVLPPEAAVGLSDYLGLLMQWNTAINLVGADTWQQAFRNLVVDSLHLASFLERLDLPREPQIWDLGAGAGLPGIPLRMVWPRGEYWLVESREKRALFLSAVLARRPLPATHIFRGRAETFADGPPPRRADLVVSRAFMPWPKLLHFLRNRLAPGGCVTLLLQTPLEPDAADGWEILACHEYVVGRAARAFTAVRPLLPFPSECERPEGFDA